MKGVQETHEDMNCCNDDEEAKEKMGHGKEVDYKEKRN